MSVTETPGIAEEADVALSAKLTDDAERHQMPLLNEAGESVDPKSLSNSDDFKGKILVRVFNGVQRLAGLLEVWEEYLQTGSGMVHFGGFVLGCVISG